MARWDDPIEDSWKVHLLRLSLFVPLFLLLVSHNFVDILFPKIESFWTAVGLGIWFGAVGFGLWFVIWRILQIEIGYPAETETFLQGKSKVVIECLAWMAFIYLLTFVFYPAAHARAVERGQYDSAFQLGLAMVILVPQVVLLVRNIARGKMLFVVETPSQQRLILYFFGLLTAFLVPIIIFGILQ